jgi:hypothetical protein
MVTTILPYNHHTHPTMSAFLQPFQSYMSSLQGSSITERSVYVSSADSHIGHELVERLLTGEFRDRFDRITAACVVPNKSKDLANLGARVIPYNYRDPPTLDDGMRGHSILVVIPPAEGGLDEVTRLIIDAGLRNQIPAIVLLSTSAANLGGGKWLPTYSALEEYVQGSSPGQWAIIRAAPLDEDLLLYSRIVQDTGKLALPMGDGAAAFVRLEDYCQYIVRVLSGFGAYGGRDEEERSWKGVHNGGSCEEDWGGEKKPRIHMIDSFFANRVLTVTGMYVRYVMYVAFISSIISSTLLMVRTRGPDRTSPGQDGDGCDGERDHLPEHVP